MKLITGASLSKAQKNEVKSRFVHRHIAIGFGKAYATEEEWINKHSFYITDSGKLSEKHHSCMPLFMAENVVRLELRDSSFEKMEWEDYYSGNITTYDAIVNEIVEQHPEWNENFYLCLVEKNDKIHPYRIKYWRIDAQ